MSGDIFLNIDRIVLRGLGRIDRSELEAALQTALTEQLASSSVHHPLEQHRVVTQITLPETVSAGQLGQSLAQNLYAVISDTGIAAAPRNVGKRGGEPNA